MAQHSFNTAALAEFVDVSQTNWEQFEQLRQSASVLKTRMNGVYQNAWKLQGSGDELARREYELCRDLDPHWFDMAHCLTAVDPRHQPQTVGHDLVRVSREQYLGRMDLGGIVGSLLMAVQERGQARALVFSDATQENRSWAYHGPTLGPAFYAAENAFHELMQPSYRKQTANILARLSRLDPRAAQKTLAPAPGSVLPQRKL